MAIITSKNPALFKAWLAYFRKERGLPDNDVLTPVLRTQAFANASNGRQPPLFV